MYRLNPDCWLGSPRPPLCLHPRLSGSFAAAVLSHQDEEEEEEEEEEEAGEHPAACCHSTGCHGAIGRAAAARWSTAEPPPHSGIPGSSGLAGGPGAPPSQQPKTVTGADGGALTVVTNGGRSWEGPRADTQGCVCVYGQREPGGLGPCWSGSPYVYCGVRRNLVFGVEVLEEVAVEDTLEVITEDIYTDELLDPELLQDTQLYTT